MSERPTPETDAFDSKWDSYSNPWEAIQLARKLELERDEAQLLLKAAQSALDAIHLEVGGWIKILKENTN